MPIFSKKYSNIERAGKLVEILVEETPQKIMQDASNNLKNENTLHASSQTIGTNSANLDDSDKSFQQNKWILS